jgi:glucosamine-6-phosphate deaminase
VALDERSRQQQVNDGCFGALAQVPAHAITLTIPALMSANEIFCVVPGPSKAAAVREALFGPVSAACPASILRDHPRATLYLDAGSAPA